MTPPGQPLRKRGAIGDATRESGFPPAAGWTMDGAMFVRPMTSRRTAACRALLVRRVPMVLSAFVRTMMLGVMMLGTAPAWANAFGAHDSNAPVNYAADHIELLDREDRVILSGNVEISQGAMTLRSARGTVAYTNEAGSLKIQRLDASGGVVVIRDGDSASGDVAVYDFTRRIITMVGKVVLHQGTGVLNGSRLVIDLNSGLTTIDGRSSGGAQGGGSTGGGGRVSGSFSVAKKAATPKP